MMPHRGDTALTVEQDFRRHIHPFVRMRPRAGRRKQNQKCNEKAAKAQGAVFQCEAANVSIRPVARALGSFPGDFEAADPSAGAGHPGPLCQHVRPAFRSASNQATR